MSGADTYRHQVSPALQNLAHEILMGFFLYSAYYSNALSKII